MLNSSASASGGRWGRAASTLWIRCHDRFVRLCFAVSLAEVKPYFIDQGRKEVLFLETRIHVFASIYWPIPRNDDHRSVRALLAHTMRELDPVHTVHAEVSDENVEILLVKFLERFLGTVGADGFVALHLENLAAEPRQHFVVVDEQDGFHAHCTFFCYLVPLMADVTMKRASGSIGGWKRHPPFQRN